MSESKLQTLSIDDSNIREYKIKPENESSFSLMRNMNSTYIHNTFNYSGTQWNTQNIDSSIYKIITDLFLYFFHIYFQFNIEFSLNIVYYKSIRLMNINLI